MSVSDLSVLSIADLYMVKKHAQMHLPQYQKALIVWKFSKGQMIEKVKNRLAFENFKLLPVSVTMTHLSQPLDLMVNDSARSFYKCYTQSITQQLSKNKQLDEIEVDFHLSTMKPFHGRWLMALYNYMTTSKGRDVIMKGWKKVGVAGLLNGTTVLPPEDPFLSLYSSKYTQ